MIRMLLRVLGHEYAQPMRRTVALMTTTAVLEGLSYALLVPVLQALFGSTPGDAWPWLITFGAAVAVYAALRYRSDLSGSESRCCAACTTVSAIIWPDCPSAGTPQAVSGRCPSWPATASCRRWA
ncbi:hypothetical protein AB0I53_44295 [Saccharopolyspora sp. NPDC050389]|uniref:hypothetical protein n=1 Tax=Saccharopolyspora sp. NPDC050389 TaxID=3155516 RepID=UPI0033F33D54